MKRAPRFLFFCLLFVVCASFFLRKNIHSVHDVHPLLLRQPIQEKIHISQPITFETKGYRYQLTPLHEYEIAALIVSKINYSVFSIYKYESIFSVDLCLIWGSNLGRGIHQDRALSFKQDCRWCWVYWQKDLGFNMNEFANTHLLVIDPRIKRIVNDLLPSDQVVIKGKLVNVVADLIQKKDDLSPTHITWNSSERRNDTGAGSCEVMYVEDVVVLKQGNVLFRWLYVIGAWLLVAIIVWRILNFFFRKDY